MRQKIYTCNTLVKVRRCHHILLVASFSSCLVLLLALAKYSKLCFCFFGKTKQKKTRTFASFQVQICGIHKVVASGGLLVLLLLLLLLFIFCYCRQGHMVSDDSRRDLSSSTGKGLWWWSVVVGLVWIIYLYLF